MLASLLAGEIHAANPLCSIEAWRSLARGKAARAQNLGSRGLDVVAWPLWSEARDSISRLEAIALEAPASAQTNFTRLRELLRNGGHDANSELSSLGQSLRRDLEPLISSRFSEFERRLMSTGLDPSLVRQIIRNRDFEALSPANAAELRNLVSLREALSRLERQIAGLSEAPVFSSISRPANFLTAPMRAIRTSAEEIWRDDYVAAWNSGRNLPERFYRFLFRATFAPRSRNPNPALRAEELREFQILPVALDPVFEGPNEILSKLKQRFGANIGLSNAPLQRRLSIPVGLVAGVFTYAKIANYFRQRRDDNYRRIPPGSGLGLPALEEWRSSGIIDIERSIELYNEHARIIQRWLEGKSSGNRRDVPPRLYQFLAEGLLTSQEEAQEFENIALESIIAAGRRVAANPALTNSYDSLVQEEIQNRLRASSAFRARPAHEIEMLKHVFDVPINLNQNQQGLAWYREWQSNGPERYLREVRQNTDIYWQRAALLAEANPAAQDSRSQTIRSAHNLLKAEARGEPVTLPSLVFFTSAHFTAEARARIEQKGNALRAIPGFPADRIAENLRLDNPSLITAGLRQYSNYREPNPLRSELDYWNLMLRHPSLQDIAVRWRAGALTSIEALRATQLRLASLNGLRALQRTRLEEGRRNNPDRQLPPDPYPQQICAIAQNSQAGGDNYLFAERAPGIVARQIGSCLFPNAATGDSLIDSSLEQCARIAVEGNFNETALSGCRQIFSFSNKTPAEVDRCFQRTREAKRGRDICRYALGKNFWRARAQEELAWHRGENAEQVALETHRVREASDQRELGFCWEENYAERLASLFRISLETLEQIVSCEPGRANSR
jgi:hypothetical protein